MHLTVQRSFSHETKPQDALFDKFVVTPGQKPILDSREFTQLIQDSQIAFRAAAAFDLGPLLGPDVAKHFEAREHALARLETLATRVIDDTNAERTRLASTYDARVSQFEETMRVREEELERKLQARSAALDNREREFEEKLKTLDDRSSTHVRRDIRSELV